MLPQRTESWTRRERASRAYRPKTIRLLLVVESPPEGDHYFYFADAAQADPLFEQVTEVLFESASDDRVAGLKELRRRGVFEVELKPDAPRRGEALAPYVGPLLINLGILAPEKIVLIGPDAYDAAYGSMSAAGLPVVDVRVPRAEEAEPFRQKFRQALVQAGLEKLIRARPTKRPESKDAGDAPTPR